VVDFTGDELDQDAIDAAIRAGEEAAAADLAADQKHLQATVDELRGQVQDLEEALEAAKAEAAEAKEKQLRVQADWENFRRRTAAERLNERARATEGLVEALLPAIDALEHALAHIKETAAGHEQAEGVAAGIEAVYAQILEAFAKEGVEQVDPKGEPFDANEAQAVSMVPAPEEYEETVLEVYRKGYKMGTHVLRPAMVVLATGGPKRPAPAPEGDAAEAGAGDSASDAEEA
jgi:molecular chaperone GrpE